MRGDHGEVAQLLMHHGGKIFKNRENRLVELNRSSLAGCATSSSGIWIIALFCYPLLSCVDPRWQCAPPDVWGLYLCVVLWATAVLGYLWPLGQHEHNQGRPQGWLVDGRMQAALRCRHVDVLCVLACSFVRICDEGDEALQPEWEIDPKDLQLMEKVSSSF